MRNASGLGSNLPLYGSADAEMLQATCRVEKGFIAYIMPTRIEAGHRKADGVQVSESWALPFVRDKGPFATLARNF